MSNGYFRTDGWWVVDDGDLNWDPDAAREIFEACGAGDWPKVERLLAENNLAPAFGKVVAGRCTIKPDDIRGGWMELAVQIEHGRIFREKEIEVPEWIAHWRDDSWGNDAVAFASLIKGEKALVMWTNYRHPEDREGSGLYGLYLYPTDSTGEYDYNDTNETLYEGDDPVACRKACAVAEGTLFERWLAGIAKTRRPTEDETNLALAAYARAAEATKEG